ITNDRNMLEAATHVVEALRLSGFVGFDFVIEQGSGRPYLIEMNLRPTPICHLATNASSDLVGALAGTPRSSINVPRFKEGDVVALFPEELWRDGASTYLRTAVHDIPTEIPEFVDAYRTPIPRKARGILRRLKDYF